MHGAFPVIGGIVVVLLVFVAYLVIEAVDRKTESPGMRRRVNEGSDKFLEERGSVWHSASRGAMAFLGEVASYFFGPP
jgi:hypothetical protein